MRSLSLKVTDALHKFILDAVNTRQAMSEKDMAQKHEKWKKDEEMQMAYLPERDADTVRRAAKEDGEVQYVTIEVPVAYAMTLSAHTYLTSIFLSRTPVLQFTGRHGESEQNVQAVETIMNYQTEVGKHLPNYYVWLMDVLKYGIGIIGHYWADEHAVRSKIVEEAATAFGVKIKGKTKRKKITERIPTYQGNRLFNVKPTDYLPDTRVPLNQPEKGEFQGRKLTLGLNELHKRKATGQYISEVVEVAIKAAGTTGGGEKSDASAQLVLPSTGPGTNETNPSGFINKLPAVEMTIELIPSMWKLGSSDYPEKWIFTVVDKKYVIEARPFGEIHDGFQFEVLQHEIDGYSLFTRSLYEIAQPLNDTMSWLFNSHFYNVRKSLNGEIIFDPSRLQARDILDGRAGKRIRVKPTGYGQDIRQMYDVIRPDAAATQTNLRDLQIVESLLQRVTGVNDNILGSLSQGGRKSATEVRASNTASVQRLKTIAEFQSADGFSPLAQALLQTTQDRMSMQRQFRIAGDAIEDPEAFMEIDKNAIAGSYDYAAVDGTLPLDRFAMVNMWSNMFAQLRNVPQVTQEYDMGKVFAHVAQLGGLKNIKQFRIQTRPEDELIKAVQNGNVLPLGGNNGGDPARNPSAAITGGGAEGGAGSEIRVPEAARTPGMGPAG